MSNMLPAPLSTAKLTRAEWSLVRSVFPRPRRFSSAFIREEQTELAAYREIFREVVKQMQQRNFVADANGDMSMLAYERRFSEDKVKDVLQIIKEYQIAPLVVGQRVLAIHPRTRLLHTASLLTADVLSYHAQFDRPDLGVVVLADTHLLPITPSDYYRPQQPTNLQLNNLRNLYLQNKFASQGGVEGIVEFEHTQMGGDNLRAMALLIMLFER